MKAVDYAIKDIMDAVSYDECGNLYIYSSNLYWEQQEAICIPTQNFGANILFVSKEDCEKYNQYEVIVPEDIGYSCCVRRPYYRMRGKPVTEEQAFDIIRKTDVFLGGINEIRNHGDFVGSLNFISNHLINTYDCGWIHADGTVGLNGITDKYPELYEFIKEWFNALRHFPYLDLMIAITWWNEIPDEAWENFHSDFNYKRLFEYEDYDEKFYEAVALGIHIHDKTVEILKSADAVKRYKEYASSYEKEREIYIPEYYLEHGIEQVDLAYLKRCIESYGLNADEVLSEIPESRLRK